MRYIYGIVLKYTANTGESVFFLVAGGRRRRVLKFRVWCACLSLYSPFSLRALSSRLVRTPSAAVFIAMDHGCMRIQTSAKCEMLLKISSRFHDDVALF